MVVTLTIMGNSAGVAKSSTPDGTKSPQTIVGVIELIKKETERLDKATKSTEAIEDFIRVTESDTLHPDDSPKERGEQNVINCVGNTVVKVSWSLDKINDQLGRLQTSLKKFGEEAFRLCEERTTDNKVEVVNKIKLHIDTTYKIVTDTKARLTQDTKYLDLNESQKNVELPENTTKTKNGNDTTNAAVTSLTDTERDRYEQEIQQLKVIIDNLEDELESLKKECSESVSSVDAANERMQTIEEKILDERLSHEVELNALRAIIERQDEIITSVNGGAVKDIWLENQKKRLFLKEFSENMDDDTGSEETCFDLIYIDQKSLLADKGKQPVSKEKRLITTKSKENINYDSSSLASTRYAIDDVATPGNEVPDSEDTKSDVGQETKTPSSVRLTFPYKKDEEEAADSKDSNDIKDVENNQKNPESGNTDNVNLKKASVSQTHDNGVSDAIKDNYIVENGDNSVSTKSIEVEENSPQCNDETNDSNIQPNRVLAKDEHNIYGNDKKIHENKPEKQKETKLTEGQRNSSKMGEVRTSNEEININNTGESGNVREICVDDSQNDQTEDKTDNKNANPVVQNARSGAEGKDTTITPVGYDQTGIASKDGHADQTINTTDVVNPVESFIEVKETDEEIVLYDEGVTKEIIYKRSDGEVDGCLSYYKGVGAIIRTTVESFGADTVQCDVTDAVLNDMLPDLVEGERAVSFHIHIQKKYGADVSIKETEFIKVFVPHRQIPEHEEATLVCSVNGEDWEQCDVIDETPASLSDGVKVLGTELIGVNDAKLVAIAREKVVSLIGGEDDVTYQSLVDPSVSVKMNTECFPARCGVSLMVHHSQQLALQSAVEIHKECRDIVSCTAFVNLVCERTTTDDMYVLMSLEPGADYECKFTIFLLEDTGWKLADCDWNKTNHLLTVHLMAGAKKYRVIGLELPPDLSVEERLLAVHALQQHTGHYTVRVMFRQKEADPTQAVVICLRASLVKQGISQLSEAGYSIGGLPSEQFCLLNGDTLTIECSGDIVARPFRSKRMDMSFYSQKEIATKQLSLHPASDDTKAGVKMYQGMLHVLKGKETGYVTLAETIHLPVEKL